MGPISVLAALSIVLTAAPSSGSQGGASVRFSLHPCSREDDRFHGSAFVWFPGRRFSPFLSPSLFARRRSLPRHRPDVWFPTQRRDRFSLRLVLEKTIDRRAGTEWAISGVCEYLASIINDLYLICIEARTLARKSCPSLSSSPCALHASMGFLVSIARHAAMVGWP